MKSKKAAVGLFRMSSDHSIEKFLIIPFLIYGGVILPVSPSYCLPILLSHYIFQSRLLYSISED